MASASVSVRKPVCTRAYAVGVEQVTLAPEIVAHLVTDFRDMGDHRDGVHLLYQTFDANETPAWIDSVSYPGELYDEEEMIQIVGPPEGQVTAILESVDHMKSRMSTAVEQARQAIESRRLRTERELQLLDLEYKANRQAILRHKGASRSGVSREASDIPVTSSSKAQAGAGAGAFIPEVAIHITTITFAQALQVLRDWMQSRVPNSEVRVQVNLEATAQQLALDLSRFADIPGAEVHLLEDTSGDLSVVFRWTSAAASNQLDSPASHSDTP